MNIAVTGVLFVALTLLLTGCSKSQKGTTVEASDVPVLEGDLIRFSEKFKTRIDLKTTEVKAAHIVPSIAVIGTVTFDPEHVARVGTRLRGLIRDVRKYEGEMVKPGDLLAAIDSPELGEAQAAVT